MKTMKKTKILAENQPKIEISVENLQKSQENLKFSAGVAQMVFWDLIPKVSDAYSQYCDYLSFIYSKPKVIIEEKENVKGKKKVGK